MKKNRGKELDEWLLALRDRFNMKDWIAYTRVDGRWEKLVAWYNYGQTLKSVTYEIRKQLALDAAKQ